MNGKTLQDSNSTGLTSSTTTLDESCPQFLNATPLASQDLKVNDSLDSKGTPVAVETLPMDNSDNFNKSSAAVVDKKAELLDTASWRRHFQEQLYNRKAEKEVLFESYEQLRGGLVSQQNPNTQHQKATLLLISGSAGTGKTRLAETLKEPALKQGGYFLTGKFDQLCRPEPYTAFVAALTEFTNMVVARGPEAVASVSKAIHQAVGSEVSVLTGMIPGLECIVGKESDATESTAKDAISRFVFVFRMFMRAVSSPQHPMVLLLDDIQWADPCSLDLLMSVVTDTGNEGLVVVSTCCDNVKPSSYLAQKLREMEDRDHVDITNITLDNLPESVVVDAVANSLALGPDKSAALAELVCRQTQGNVFYIIEFLRWLQSSGLLFFDECNNTWSWDVDEIHLTIDTCGVGGFLVDKLEQLPSHVKEVIKVAACLGSHVNEELIEYVLKKPVGDTLIEGAAMGVFKLDESRGSYAFEHDCVQAAAYRLIPADELELFHLEIGRRLWRQVDSDELDRHIFVLLSQMKIGRRLISREKERMAIASLCLHAAKKAAKSSTFRTASVYLNFAIEILQNRGWRDDYNLTLTIYNAAAEMEMCTANFETMEGLLDTVFANARTFEDKIQAYATRIYGLGVVDQGYEATELGIEVLKGLGEKFPSRHCLAHVLRELRTVRKLLKGKSDEQLLRLPIVENKEKLAAMKILQLIYLNALMVRPKFAPFVTLKLLKLTLQYGLSVFASSAFATYGMLLIGSFGEIDEGFRYGEVGMSLLEQFKANEYLPRVYAAFYGCLYPWKKPIKGSLEPLHHAYRIGMQTGDIEFASLCANLYCFTAVDAGVPLDVIDRTWSSFSDVMVSNKLEALLSMVSPSVQAVHHYMGLSEDPLAAKGDVLDYDEALQSAIEHKRVTNVVGIKLCRTSVAYIFNAYDLAAELCVDMRDIWLTPPTFERVSSLVMCALVSLQMIRQGIETRKHLKTAKQIIKTMKKLATHSPHNCLEKLFLLEAELASVSGQNDKAYEKYTCAIALAADSKILMMHALANERAARHLLAIGNSAAAEPYFHKACASYEEWKGMAKVKQLQAEIDSIYTTSSHA